MSVWRSDILAYKKTYKSSRLLQKSALGLSTWFGIGLLPGAPGTYGTAAALPVCFLTKYAGFGFEGLLLLMFVALAVWATEVGARTLGREDPSEFVIDEVAGFLVTVAFLPLTWWTVAGGFILFRFFDILKPYPISTLERRIRGGTGIVLDDLLAGAYSNVSLRVLGALIGAWNT